MLSCFGKSRLRPDLATEIFAAQRKDNIDLSGVAVLEPQLTVLPQIEANGMMRLAGFFPSVPTQVNFELPYASVNRQWRLFGVSVSLGQAAPVAPPPAEPRPRRRRGGGRRKPRPRRPRAQRTLRSRRSRAIRRNSDQESGNSACRRPPPG